MSFQNVKNCLNCLSIPDICHLGHLHVGGEEICHVEKFQISIHGISPLEEEFQFFYTTDVEKYETLPNFKSYLHTFVSIQKTNVRFFITRLGGRGSPKADNVRFLLFFFPRRASLVMIDDDCWLGVG